MNLRKHLEQQHLLVADQAEVIRARKQPSKRTIRSHASFVPGLTAWGAALFGLSVMVLPADWIARFAMVAGTASLGPLTKYLLAAVAAVLGGGIGYVTGAALRESTSGPSADLAVARQVTSRRVRPIDPATDLGSASLDSPLDPKAFAADEEEGDYAELAEAEVHEQGEFESELARRGLAMPAPEDILEGSGDVTIAPSDEEVPPRELDLAEFAAMPGRNAVWVEEQAGVAEDASEDVVEDRDDDVADAAPAPVTRDRPARARPAPETALEKLREVPPQDLSLVQMVERFAAALHEHQAASHARPAAGPDAKGDAALAEALKALDMFGPRGFDEDSEQSGKGDLTETGRELRAALVKLQALRGAA